MFSFVKFPILRRKSEDNTSVRTPRNSNQGLYWFVNFHNRFDKALTEIFQFRWALLQSDGLEFSLHNLTFGNGFLWQDWQRKWKKISLNIPLQLSEISCKSCNKLTFLMLINFHNIFQIVMLKLCLECRWISIHLLCPQKWLWMNKYF